MTTQSTRGRGAIAMVTAVNLLLSPMVPLLPAQTAPAPKEGEEAVDGGWPRSFEMSSARQLTIYEPQVASWDRQKHVVAYAAVAYSTSAANKPDLGSIKLESDTAVSLEERLVRFAAIDLTEANFPKLSREQTGEITRFIRETIPEKERVIALDRMMAATETSAIVPKDVPGIKADPPKIFFSNTPAILVNLDGEAIWSPIPENDLQFAVNTNWDLFQHGPTKTFYLRHESTWLKASSLEGPWAPAGKLPESFSKLPADANWTEVKAAIPGKKLDAKKAPQVFVSLEPAELILLQGKPKYEKVEGTALLWVSNTESDVFRTGTSGAIYYLVAGRWFAANDFSGPWTFATPALPPDFQKIPLEHPRSRVLASVPGTRQAAEAILLAEIPGNGAGQHQDAEGAGGFISGGAQVRAREGGGSRRERGQYRQGHLQDRRQVLHVLQRRLVLLEGAERAMGSRDQRSERDYRSPRARRTITSPTSPSRTTTTATNGLRSRWWPATPGS